MRRLAAAALSFSAAVFLAVYRIEIGRLPMLAALLALLGAVLLLLRKKALRLPAAALLFAALGLAHVFAYTNRTQIRAADIAGQTVTVEGSVLDYPDVYERYNRLRIRIDGGDLPHAKAIVYDNDQSLTEVRPGDRVCFQAAARTADTLYGKPYDNYLVNGFFYRLTIRGEAELTPARFSLRTVPVKLQRFLSGRMERIFPADTLPFLQALLLGDRERFYDDDALYVSMTRAGLMHIVAVSGLHVAFLVSLLTFIFGKGRTGTLLSIAALWFFVLVTGAGKAAVRAGFMQTVLLMAPLLRRENDPITSLSAVLAVCLAVNPYSAKSVSLQLSYSAMAGILIFFEQFYKALEQRVPERLRVRPVRYLLAALASSLSVMPFTIPLTALHFGYVPLLSLVANPLCLWAVSLCFSLGWVACTLSVVPALGAAVGWLDAWLVRYILLAARFVSAFPHAVLYTQTPGAWLWIGATYACFLAAILLRKQRRPRLGLPALLSAALLIGILWHAWADARSHESVAALDVGQGQCVAVIAGEATALIDCGSGSTLDNAGAEAGEYLLSRGRTSVDLLVLTHLHADHANGVVRLMELIPVKTLILPARTDRSNPLLLEILESAGRHGTQVVEIGEGETQLPGQLTMTLYSYPGGRSENTRGLMILLHAGQLDALVTGDAGKTAERWLAQSLEPGAADVLVVGHHGSAGAACEELLTTLGAHTALISVGYNTYGHPAPETLRRLEALGYTVRRTDEEGTVILTREELHG